MCSEYFATYLNSLKHISGILKKVFSHIFLSVTFSGRKRIIFGSLLVLYPVQCTLTAIFCIVNTVVILDSRMASVVNFMGGSANSKNNNEERYISSYV